MKRVSLNMIKVITVGVAVSLIMIAGCRRNRESRTLEPTTGPATSNPAPPYPVKEAALTASKKAFNHQDHKLDCNLCHDRIAEANPKCSKTDSANVAVRDSSESLTPCFPAHDACIYCHQNEFLPSRVTTPEGQAWCARCHKSTNSPVTFVKFTTMESEFGVRGRSNKMRGFSHKDHMDPAKMTDNPSLAKCSTCHKAIAGGISYTMPGHPECYQCHTHQAAAATQQPRAQCVACHADKVDETVVNFSRKVQAAYSVYNFIHAKHVVKAACERCHQQIDSPPVAKSDILLISTAAGLRHASQCWTCHKLSGTKEQNCNYCHLGGERPFRSRVGVRAGTGFGSTE